MKQDGYRHIPNNLRKYRKERGLTQDQVAHHFGYKDKTWISHWENGDSFPSLINAIRLSLLYKAPVTDLFEHHVKMLEE